jgi:hypothetical protein
MPDGNPTKHKKGECPFCLQGFTILAVKDQRKQVTCIHCGTGWYKQENGEWIKGNKSVSPLFPSVNETMPHGVSIK